MSEVLEEKVNTSSKEFKQGVEAGLNSAKDNRNWQAGNDLGQALKVETTKKTNVDGNEDSETPLFLRSSPEGKQGNAQDEKDAAEE
jgi:hypothetical protein